MASSPRNLPASVKGPQAVIRNLEGFLDYFDDRAFIEGREVKCVKRLGAADEVVFEVRRAHLPELHLPAEGRRVEVVIARTRIDDIAEKPLGFLHKHVGHFLRVRRKLLESGAVVLNAPHAAAKQRGRHPLGLSPLEGL